MWVIANFKQNPISEQEAVTLAKNIAAHEYSAKVVLAPSHLHLSAVVKALKDTKVMVCAQDVSVFCGDVGAYTGDVGAKQVAAAGACMAIIGHSERRTYHSENNKILASKIANAQQAGLFVVFCVGESDDDNKAGRTFAVLDEQLAPLMALTDKTQILVAYEPVWAIGSGRAAMLADIEPVHRYIKEKLPTTAVLYGGSVNADNAGQFASSALIDGVLVGGASLKVDSFCAIVRACC